MSGIAEHMLFLSILFEFRGDQNGTHNMAMRSSYLFSNAQIPHIAFIVISLPKLKAL